MRAKQVTTERTALTVEIKNEMVDYTGQPVEFRFTEAMTLAADYLWHEIELADGTTMWTSLRDNGSAVVVLDLDEAGAYED